MIPRIRIEQQFAQIGLNTTQGRLEVQSPKGELEIQRAQTQMTNNVEPGSLNIDSSDAWMALGKGKHLNWLKLVYSQMDQQYLNNLGSIVEEGNRLAKFSDGSNAIAEIASQRFQETSLVQYTGEASYNNVKLEYKPSRNDMSWTSGNTDIQYKSYKPEVSYSMGEVKTYMRQQNWIKFDVHLVDKYV
ncbi:DUF6470 family protein [Paenibacillus sp. MER 180]|uniref:DUF6470 family protein n=1 Tax=Paenibacillus sp. MER 180 TaxID=2939570 RepID=UPI00203C5848|nr:DUF6470 family protein [Paenibacillus sp. MER 180]MCM3288570.1 DUF6470 family protein [Paenibacillus sp. MER 180]